MFANLPMYDLEPLRAETDALWSAIAAALRARGIEAPERLARPAHLPDDWLRPDLLLSQTCGLPFARRLRGRVGLVGGVAYDVPDCSPGSYRSRIVVRAGDPAQAIEDMKGRIVAINSDDSQSGSGSLRMVLRELGAPHPFFARIIETGAHVDSIRAVARGDADIAAIDAVTFALASRFMPEVQGLRVIGLTPKTPGLPLVTRLGRPTEALFEAVGEAIEAVGPAVRAALMLRGVVQRREEDFDGIAEADATMPPLG